MCPNLPALAGERAGVSLCLCLGFWGKTASQATPPNQGQSAKSTLLQQRQTEQRPAFNFHLTFVSRRPRKSCLGWKLRGSVFLGAACEWGHLRSGLQPSPTATVCLVRPHRMPRSLHLAGCACTHPNSKTHKNSKDKNILMHSNIQFLWRQKSK